MPAAHAGIVAEQQQTFAGLVEPADRRQPRQPGPVEAAIDGIAPAFVARGSDQAARLVEHQIDARGLTLDLTFVDGDPLAAVRQNRKFGIADDASVDAHATGSDPARGFGPRAQAALG